MRRDLRALLSSAAVYAVFYAAYFFRSLISGDYIAPSDSLDFGLAAFLSQQTLWTDWLYSGYPIAADPQSMTWYPVFQLLRATGVGWNVYIVAPYLIASLGCFLLVWRMTGVWLAALFAGFVYGFSGMMLAHISHFNQIHAAAWLPFVIYGLQLTREGHGREGALVGSAAFALMIAAGHPQIVVYTLYLAVALVCTWVFIDRQARSTAWRRLSWSAGALLLGAALASVVILPVIELASFAARGTPSLERYASTALPPRQLLSMVFPLLFGGFRTSIESAVPYVGESSPGEMTGYAGLLPLSLLAAGAFMLRRMRADVRIWAGLAVVAAVLCLGTATPLGSLFYHVPGYASFRVPARHLFIVTFCVAVGSGLAFAQLYADLKGRRKLAAAVAATLLAGAGIAMPLMSRDPTVEASLTEHPMYLTWAIILPCAVAAAFAGLGLLSSLAAVARRVPAVLIGLLMLGLHLGEMAAFHYVMPGYNLEYAEVPESWVTLTSPMVPLRDELRRTGERVLVVDGSRNWFLRPNLTRAWAVPAASGTGALGIERYLTMLDMGGPGDISPRALAPDHRGADLFAVRYLLVPKVWRAAPDLELPATRWTPLAELRFREDDPDPV